VLAWAWRRFLGGESSPFWGDVAQYHHPVTLELVRAWSAGRIPLWTDGVYCGFPFFADPQTAAWYPGTLLVAGLGPHQGTIVFLFLHSLLAAFGGAAWARSHRCGELTAWSVGILVALSGCYAHEIQHPGLFAILCWLPTWLWTTHRVFERPSPGRVAVAALPVAAMIFAGTLQVLFGALVLYAAYTLGLLVAARGRPGPRAVTRLGATAASQILGLGLAGVALIPAVAHLPRTARALGMAPELAAMGSVRPAELLGVFFDTAGSLGGIAGFEGASFYVGVLVLPLAVLALVGPGGGRRVLASSLALALLAIALVALGGHGPLPPFLERWLPAAAGSLRGLGRALGPGSLALALLAGLGLDRLRDPEAVARRQWLVVVGGAAGLQLAWIVAAPTPAGAAAVAGPAVLAGAFALGLAARWRPRLLQPGVAVLLALDLLAFGALDGVLRASPPPPDRERVEGRLPGLADVARRVEAGEDGRVLLPPLVPHNLPLVAGLEGVSGYNPLVTLDYLDFVALVDDGRLFPRRPLAEIAHVASPLALDSPLLDAAAVRFVVAARPLEIPGWRLAASHPSQATWLYENAEALPRAYLGYHTTPVLERAALPDALGPGFDGRRTSVVEDPGPPLDGPPGVTPVARVRERPEVLQFDIAPERDALLVLADAWYPGWRARVDGAEAPVLRVNGLFRGVRVPAGARRVVLRFEPWTFTAGAWTSLASALVLGALGALALRRPREGERADSA